MWYIPERSGNFGKLNLSRFFNVKFFKYILRDSDYKIYMKILRDHRIYLWYYLLKEYI